MAEMTDLAFALARLNAHHSTISDLATDIALIVEENQNFGYGSGDRKMSSEQWTALKRIAQNLKQVDRETVRLKNGVYDGPFLDQTLDIP